mmetsp:Transcript_7140/g.6335  ORF Transcript_7140/g.6335 Transcript_7140/m.6335 type:complete len:91 (+) Transcript_7140:53-325(+)
MTQAILKERKEEEEQHNVDEVTSPAQSIIFNNKGHKDQSLNDSKKLFSLLSIKSGNFHKLNRHSTSSLNKEVPLTSRETWLTNWKNSGVR